MERRNFIKSAGAAGVAAIGVASAGCLGENTEQSQQPGDEPVQPQGWFSIGSGVRQGAGDNNLQVNQTSLFRTPNGFGVLGNVKNTGDQPYVRVTIHVQLQTDGGEVIGNFSQGFSEQEAIDDLGSGEVWQWRIFFEGTDPQIFQAGGNQSGGSGGNQSSGAQQSVSNYQVWATGNLRGSANTSNVGDGNNNFLFDGNLLTITENGDVLYNDQTVGTVSIVADNTSGAGFQNVFITQNGEVVNQQGQVVGQVQVQQMMGGNSSGN